MKTYVSLFVNKYDLFRNILLISGTKAFGKYINTFQPPSFKISGHLKQDFSTAIKI